MIITTLTPEKKYLAIFSLSLSAAKAFEDTVTDHMIHMRIVLYWTWQSFLYSLSLQLTKIPEYNFIRNETEKNFINKIV